MADSNPVSNKKRSELDFLEKSALDLGAVEAKVVPINNIVVEDRVVLKCRVGCPGYGKKLSCPPFIPTVDEFRKMLKDYEYALLVKFRANAEMDDTEVAQSLLRCQFDPAISNNHKEKALKFMSDFNEDKKRFHSTILELEKTAFNKGYTLAVGFSIGSCSLCKECKIEEGMCIYPTMVRLPEHGVGVNIKKTVEKAGMTINFPFQKKPEPIGLLLID